MTARLPLAAWQAAADDGAALAALLEAGAVPPVALLARLRSERDPDHLAALVELASVRRRAAGRYRSLPGLVADREGLEQAASEAAAGAIADRFAALDPAPGRVFDLCAGIGICAWAIGRHVPVLAVEREPVRAWMARRNAGCAVVCADVRSLRLRGQVVHIDPSRRLERRRVHRYEDARPGPEVIEPLLERNPDMALRLGPGVEFASLPRPERCEIEVAGSWRGLEQAVLWTGRLAWRPGERTALALPDGLRFSAVPEPLEIARAPGRWLFTAHPAIERAGLLGALAARCGLEGLHPGLGLLSADRPVASPWLRRFELLASMPWNERRVRAALVQRGVGRLEVKTRGLRWSADEIARRLRRGLRGSKAAVLFVQRFGTRVRALLARRTDETGGRAGDGGAPQAGSPSP